MRAYYYGRRQIDSKEIVLLYLGNQLILYTSKKKQRRTKCCVLTFYSKKTPIKSKQTITKEN